MKKIILIILLFISTMLLSCSDNGNSGEDTPINQGSGETGEIIGSTDGDIDKPENIEETVPPIDLPEKNYGGRDFNVITREFNLTTEYHRMFAVEEENGDSINDAVYKRTVNVEEKYNVNINQIISNGPADTARRSIMAGDDEYNLVVEVGWAGFPLANENLVVNLYEVPYISEAMYQNKPWWDSAIIRDMAINGKLYFQSGDIIMSDDILVYVILFNKDLFAKNNLEYPYQSVNDGTWTYDNMFALTRGLNKDINGDGILDEYDQWGILGENHSANRLFQSAGETSIKIGDNGYPYFALEEPRAIDVMNKLMPFITDGESMLRAEQIKNPRTESVWSDMAVLFQENRIFMWLATLGNVTQGNLRAMATDFGIIPTPKYNESQENYYTFVEMSAAMISVPTTTDPDFTGHITEALAYESVSTVTPAFYDLTLATKTARDNESEAMLDIIFNNKIYDLGTFNTNFLVHDIFASAVSSNQPMVSMIDSKRNAINAAIEKFNAGY